MAIIDTPTIPLIGAPCDGNCSFQDSVRNAGAQLLIALNNESAMEILSSTEVDGVLIHQDNVGFGEMIASEVQTRWPDKPQTMVCQECIKQPLVPFGGEAFSGLKELSDQQRSGSYLLYSSEGLLSHVEGKVDRQS